MKQSFVILIPILVLLFHLSFAQGGPKVQLSIVYTNDVMGEVEPCG